MRKLNSSDMNTREHNLKAYIDFLRKCYAKAAPENSTWEYTADLLLEMFLKQKDIYVNLDSNLVQEKLKGNMQLIRNHVESLRKELELVHWKLFRGQELPTTPVEIVEAEAELFADLCCKLLVGVAQEDRLRIDEAEEDQEKVAAPPPLVGSGRDPQKWRLTNELVKVVEELAMKGENLEVIRVASALDRPFWLSGRFEERVAIGYYLKRAAAALEDSVALLSALIDMTGWTNAIIGNINEAMDNLHQGIEFAHVQKQPYWLAKGYRHLGGIHYLYTNDLEAARICLENASNSAQIIIDERKKREMFAGIHYGMSEIYLRQSNYSQALEQNGFSRFLYEEDNDRERLIKVNIQLGQILFALGETDRAREILLQAANSAQELERPHESALALEWLGRIYLRENQVGKAELYLLSAKLNLDVIGVDSNRIKQLVDEIDY